MFYVILIDGVEETYIYIRAELYVFEQPEKFSALPIH